MAVRPVKKHWLYRLSVFEFIDGEGHVLAIPATVERTHYYVIYDNGYGVHRFSVQTAASVFAEYGVRLPEGYPKRGPYAASFKSKGK